MCGAGRIDRGCGGAAARDYGLQGYREGRGAVCEDFRKAEREEHPRTVGQRGKLQDGGRFCSFGLWPEGWRRIGGRY